MSPASCKLRDCPGPWNGPADHEGCGNELCGGTEHLVWSTDSPTPPTTPRVTLGQSLPPPEPHLGNRAKNAFLEGLPQGENEVMATWPWGPFPPNPWAVATTAVVD